MNDAQKEAWHLKEATKRAQEMERIMGGLVSVAVAGAVGTVAMGVVKESLRGAKKNETTNKEKIL